jgi:hypothetical protein
VLGANAGSSSGHYFAVRRSKAQKLLGIFVINFILAVNAKMAVFVFIGRDFGFIVIEHRVLIYNLSIVISSEA